MKKFFQLLLILCSVLIGWLQSQTIEFTKRTRNEVREGPGNFYPLIIVLPAGVKVPVTERVGGWTKFTFTQETRKQISQNRQVPEFVWLSNNCLQDKATRQNMEDLSRAAVSPAASPSARAAAIRGFGVRYGRATENKIVNLENTKGVDFTPNEYFSFRRETQLVQDNSLIQRFPKYFQTEYATTNSEQGIGLGVASRIAARGIVDDPKTLKYLNLLATYLLESSGAYDYQFKIYLLKATEINAYSVIGGYIFFTEGMIKACHDEAELAGIIAHEIMHVVLKHGVKEMEQRKGRIEADMGFAELDQETGTEDPEEIRELEEYALSAYENASKHRLLGYENEADAGACLLLAAVGYDPKAVSRAIQHIRNIVKGQQGSEEDNPFAYVDFEKRLNAVNGFLSSSLPNAQGGTNQPRFLKFFKSY